MHKGVIYWCYYMTHIYDLGNIECRKLHRYQLFNQRSEREYLGKLYCIRKADRNWVSDPATRNWLREMTSAVIRGLLIVDGTDPEPFQEAFDSLLDYSWRHPEKLKEELRIVQKHARAARVAPLNHESRHSITYTLHDI